MILQIANKIPPFLCRIIARDKSGFRSLSHSEVAARSGIPRSTVADLSKLNSWDGIPIDVADRFASACGVNLARPRQHLAWLRTAGLAHIKRAGAHQRRFFAALLQQQHKP